MSLIIDFDATVSGKSLTLSYPVLQQDRVKPRIFLSDYYAFNNFHSCNKNGKILLTSLLWGELEKRITFPYKPKILVST